MPIKKYKPYTPTRRFATGLTFSEITKQKPEKSLLAPWKSQAGKDASGHTSIRFRRRPQAPLSTDRLQAG